MERLTKTFDLGEVTFTFDLGGVAFTFDLDITCQPSEIKNFLNLATKLKEYENLEELIGILLKELAEIFKQHIPGDCKHPKKAIVLTDGDVDKWRKYKDLEEQDDLALLTRHFKKDNSNMQFDRPLPTKGEKYKHFKVGKIVTVIGISRHTETEEITVVYEYEGTVWNRPLEMFMSEVDHEKYPNVSQKYRFEKVESEG